jgi:hypothetical protein
LEARVIGFNVTSNIDQVLGFTARVHPQFRFALSLGMNTTIRKGRDGAVAALDRQIDKPTPFTRGGFFLVPARKDKLSATVGIKDKQAEYMVYQVEGGTRAPKNVALRLPAAVQLNDYGNLPAGVIKQLIARAQAGKHATKRQSKRFGISQELDLFYGDPGDGRPAGIYKRVVISATRHQLIPIVVFPRKRASYSKRYDFFGAVDAIVRREFPTEAKAAWVRALATAK